MLIRAEWTWTRWVHAEVAFETRVSQGTAALGTLSSVAEKLIEFLAEFLLIGFRDNRFVEFHPNTPFVSVRCPQTCAFTDGVMDRFSNVSPVRVQREVPQPAISVSQPSGFKATISVRE